MIPAIACTRFETLSDRSHRRRSGFDLLCAQSVGEAADPGALTFHRRVVGRLSPRGEKTSFARSWWGFGSNRTSASRSISLTSRCTAWRVSPMFRATWAPGINLNCSECG